MPDPETILIDLSYKGLICVSGADAVPFLQGQLSTDVEKLTPEFSQLSSWSNAKGRVVAIMRVFRHDDHIFLSLAASLKSAVLKRLSMYVLRSRVKLADAGDGMSTLGLIGQDAPALLHQAGIPVPPGLNAMTRGDGIQAIHLHGELPRYLIYGSAEILRTLQRRWEPATTPGTDDSWALHKILASEPTIYTETSEHFVAQMLGLEELGSIDFQKGCYTGQEVIARAHYRGGVKRHMVRAACDTGTMLKPGMEIHDVEQDSPVAEIVDARRDEAGVWQMLVVIQDDFRSAPLMIGAAPVTLS